MSSDESILTAPRIWPCAILSETRMATSSLPLLFSFCSGGGLNCSPASKSRVWPLMIEASDFALFPPLLGLPRQELANWRSFLHAGLLLVAKTSCRTVVSAAATWKRLAFGTCLTVCCHIKSSKGRTLSSGLWLVSTLATSCWLLVKGLLS